mmetsp:Transcript_16087/g.64969  ORF Transcript_16087/g.64969 Transcript_16087/m.64969 type:complete len:237 (-) Transcript_16087:76-786(-)
MMIRRIPVIRRRLSSLEDLEDLAARARRLEERGHRVEKEPGVLEELRLVEQEREQHGRFRAALDDLRPADPQQRRRHGGADEQRVARHVIRRLRDGLLDRQRVVLVDFGGVLGDFEGFGRATHDRPHGDERFVRLGARRGERGLHLGRVRAEPRAVDEVYDRDGRHDRQHERGQADVSVQQIRRDAADPDDALERPPKDPREIRAHLGRVGLEARREPPRRGGVVERSILVEHRGK